MRFFAHLELNSLIAYTSGGAFGEGLKRKIKKVLCSVSFSINFAVFEVINRGSRTSAIAYSAYIVHRCAFIS
jgi:hypothetical protein